MGGFKVLLPLGCGGGQHYFFASDYGGFEAALVEAQIFRDERFKLAGIDLHARLRVIKSRVASGVVLPMAWEYDAKRKAEYVRGAWTESTARGTTRRRAVKRYAGALRTRAQAWAEVEAIVRKGVEDEAARVRACLQGGL